MITRCRHVSDLEEVNQDSPYYSVEHRLIEEEAVPVNRTPGGSIETEAVY